VRERGEEDRRGECVRERRMDRERLERGKWIERDRKEENG
jgi:hypothetical protein